MPQTWHENWPIANNTITEEDFHLSGQKIWGEEDENGIFHQIEHRKSALNTLGNLTILTNSLNPSVSNASYTMKRPEITKQSTLILNSYFHDIHAWDENAIISRGESLFKSISNIWKYSEKIAEPGA